MSKIELLITKDIYCNGMGIHLKPRVNLSLTEGLIDEVHRVQTSVVEDYLHKPWDGVFYLIWYIDNRQLSGQSKGLDFHLIHNAFKYHQEKKIESYIDKLFKVVYLNYVGLALPVINCSIINKKTSDISIDLLKEFFLLNRICFLFNHSLRPGEIKPFLVTDVFQNLSFNQKIYSKNRYFRFGSLRMDKMRSAIETVDFEPFTKEELDKIKAQFDGVKKNILKRIFDVAEHNVKIFERLKR